MTERQSDIGKTFRTLHEQAGIFVIPNPWDIGTARILAAMDFPALATTSAGMAFAMGLPEGSVSREDSFAHCREIVEATALPVSADLEKGFGDSPGAVANCIQQAADIGLAGCSIEDHTNRPEDPIFDFNHAVDRIAAAVEVCRAQPNDFVLTARAENFLWGRRDLDDTIKRLQAFSDVGADVLYAPGLHDLETIRTVCESVDKPVNVVMGMPGATFSIEQLAEVGVKRISVGSAFTRVAYGAFVSAAREIKEQGRFSFSDTAMGFDELNQFFMT